MTVTVGRKRRGGKKRKQSHFIDVALEGFAREMAQGKYKEVLDLEEVNGIPLAEAYDTAGHFPERGPYFAIWRRWWLEPSAGAGPLARENLMAWIDKAIREAVMEEKQKRIEMGDADIEENLDFQNFSGRAMNFLLREADGEIEEEL